MIRRYTIGCYTISIRMISIHRFVGLPLQQLDSAYYADHEWLLCAMLSFDSQPVMPLVSRKLSLKFSEGWLGSKNICTRKLRFWNFVDKKSFRFMVYTLFVQVHWCREAGPIWRSSSFLLSLPSLLLDGKVSRNEGGDTSSVTFLCAVTYVHVCACL